MVTHQPFSLRNRTKSNQNYLISTFAPASSNSFLSASASALAIPSFNTAGADSTKSLASFKPKPVAPRTALITATLLAPASARTTSNSVFSSAAATAPPAGAAATAAAAETPNFSSIAAINSTISVTDLEAIASMICSLVNDITINS
ncbi:hypothetical protein CF65_00353 [Aggregatibacter actinomycetemcomitans HK1651]|nr:hypothetical protein CF65_00353 [Aggregatibacter actinomycetemcomitans HK1651]